MPVPSIDNKYTLQDLVILPFAFTGPMRVKPIVDEKVAGGDHNPIKFVFDRASADIGISGELETYEGTLGFTVRPSTSRFYLPVATDVDEASFYIRSRNLINRSFGGIALWYDEMALDRLGLSFDSEGRQVKCRHLVWFKKLPGWQEFGSDSYRFQDEMLIKLKGADIIDGNPPGDGAQQLGDLIGV